MIAVSKDSLPLAPLGPKGNSNFEILLVEIFSPKQKKILPATIEKINFVSLGKQPHVPSDNKRRWNIVTRNGLSVFPFLMTIVKIKQSPSGRFRHIHAYSGILRHDQTYSGIILAYSGILRTLCNSGIFKTLVYSEPDAYSEFCRTSLVCFVKIVKGWYTYDVHEKCLIFKTSHHPVHVYPKIFPPPWRWTSNFKQTTPTLSPTNYGAAIASYIWANEIKTKTKPSHATFRLFDLAW